MRADGEKQSLWIKQVASGTYMQVIPPAVSYYGWLMGRSERLHPPPA